MDTHFSLSDGEQLLAEGVASHLKNVISVDSGYCYLTNIRFVFCKKQMTLSLLAGPIGPIVSGFRKQRRITFEIPITSIKAIDRKKYGFTYKDSLRLDSNQIITLQLQDDFVKCIEGMGVPITIKG